ncbi:hypothetical protein TWF506_004437 [Arthrobotrys conoides]|uniref:Nephrocystin 3-like N-terminal domain-containing protein n=1 Tax=Arthrobotrys conoides TaxID=74498 RepID=A0AAN8N0P5_9PEZI
MTTQLKPNPVTVSGDKGKRKTLQYCFRNAQEKLRNEAIGRHNKNEDLHAKETAVQKEFEEFLRGSTNITDLVATFERTPEKEKKDEKFDQLMATLSRVKSLGDELMTAAPETVSLVWFGISSLISIGTMKTTVRQSIYSTCNSILSMVEVCFQLEKREQDYDQSLPRPNRDASNLSIWDSDIPELIFLILDFLWHAKPHRTSKGLKGFGKTIKEAFTGALEEKSTVLLAHYQTVVDKAQKLYENFLICENIEISGVAKDLIDIVDREFLGNELDRQKKRLEASRAHEVHFKTLQSRLEDITTQRKIIEWLLIDTTFLDWKSRPTNAGLLCLEAPRGHGKSIAMARIYQTLRAEDSNIILRFFFKKGDNDIQKSQTALETLLFQLLDEDRIRSDCETLAKVVEVLNPSYGSEKPTTNSITFDNPGKISEVIQKIASIVPNHIYLIVDALDECQDRREKAILRCLQSLLKDNLHIIISSRDTIHIQAELASNGYSIVNTPQQFETAISPVARIISITKANNAEDVQEYLKFEVGQVMGRLMNKDRNESYFSSRVAKIVDTIFSKANGDFTRARLIITHLKQPSKLPLDKKIETLPDSIGDIYMSSLEALTPNQQELVVTALKWIVWGVSGIHISEISDHYREIYQHGHIAGESSSENMPLDCNPEDNPLAIANCDLSPFREENLGPEVKEILNHLRDGGRDFFRYDPDTGLVTVDISIREWVTNDTATTSGVKKPSMMNGFHRYRDANGYTVFKLTLTPSFVKYGDLLSPLFNEREAQLNLTLNILRTLNNDSFQEKHMPWYPHWRTETEENPEPKYRSRYEIDHWHDHLAILQKWWTEDSIHDVWWSSLLQELDEFMRPENWYRWNIQRRPDIDVGWPNTSNARELDYWYDSFWLFEDRFTRKTLTAELFLRYFEKPIHFASQHGLQIILEYLTAPGARGPISAIQELNPSEKIFQYLDAKFEAICVLYEVWYDGIWYRQRYKEHIAPLLSFEEGSELLNFMFRATRWDESDTLLVGDIISSWDITSRMGWLANQTGSNLQKVKDFFTNIEINGANDLWKSNAYDIRKPGLQYGKAFSRREAEYYTIAQLCDVPDGLNRVPLFIGALNPKVRRHLIKCGADINATVYRGYSVTIVLQLLKTISSVTDIDKPRFLDGVQDLLTKGVNLDNRYHTGASALHYAAEIQNLSLFRQICQLKTWNVLDTDKKGKTPMHYLFSRRPPDSRVGDAFEIFQTLVRMGPSPSEVVNAQDKNSEGPLACAVRAGFITGIEWLASQNVDIHDDNSEGQNCFHHLVHLNGDDAIMNSMGHLLSDKLGIDWRKRDNTGRTPLYLAIAERKTSLALFLLQLYSGLPPDTSYKDEILPQNEEHENILILLACLPYSDELYEGVIKVAGGKIDVYGTWGSHETRPLEIAIKNLNVGIAQRILESGPYSCRKDEQNEVDTCCAALKSFDRTDLDSITKMKHILRLLFRHCPTDAICALRYLVFLPGNEFLDDKEQREIASEADPLATDNHGWTTAALLHVLNNDRFKHLQVEGYEKTFNKQKIPTGFVPIESWIETHFVHTEDGLKFTFDTEPYKDMVGHMDTIPRVWLSDHPIALARKTTYFEVSFTSAEDDHPAIGKVEDVEAQEIDGNGDNSSGVLEAIEYRRYVSVGVRSRVNPSSLQEREEDHVGIEFCSDGAVRTLLQRQGRLIVKPQVWNTENRNGRQGLRGRVFRASSMKTRGNHVIGCGINSLEGKIFFTANGKIVPQWFPTLDAQQFLIITMAGYHVNLDGFLVNFGKIDFAFKEANEPGWQWDGKVPEADYGTKVSYPPPRIGTMKYGAFS